MYGNKQQFNNRVSYSQFFRKTMVSQGQSIKYLKQLSALSFLQDISNKIKNKK